MQQSAQAHATHLQGMRLEGHDHIDEVAFERLLGLFREGRGVLLTGAGCSTESGIPDYRGPETQKKKRNPILYKDFVGDEDARVRYWARSAVGWPRFLEALPNVAHRAMAQLEQERWVTGIITQNVDRLHQKAGADRVVELHGALAEVKCLACGEMEDRGSLQERLFLLNPQGLPSVPESSAEEPEVAPDGDAVLAPEQTRGFQVPSCLICGGMLKPNVVFFGENVAKPVVDRAWGLLDEADFLLVVGSSLTVYSGYRFVKGAEKRGMPVVIVNIGETRGDPHASIRINARVGVVMPRLIDILRSL